MSDRVDIDHMRLSTGHLVTMRLSDQQLQQFLLVVRSGTDFFNDSAEPNLQAGVRGILDAIDRLAAAATAPIEPNHP